MPPKKQKPDPKMKVQDLPPAIRKNVTEFLPPTYRQQDQLSAQYFQWRSDDLFAKTAADEGWTDTAEMFEKDAKRNKAKYHQMLENFTKAPGIHETYKYFWDDDKPWPDQNGGNGGGRPITS
jgi:hypothetical protein